jgi:hypothetical protein
MANTVSFVPVPQADDLDKVVATVEAVAAGHHTGPEIASALDVVERQGFYYVAAAEQLGLVMHVAKDDIQLTKLGSKLATDEVNRKRLLRSAVLELPVIRHIAHDLGIGKPTWAQKHLFTDRMSVTDTLEEAGFAHETAYRRSGTINSWIKALE